MAPAVWTEEAIRALGVRTDVETAGSIFGLSRTQSYERIRDGTFPAPVVRIGRRMIVPTAPIRRLLAIDMETAGPAPPGPADHTVTTTLAKGHADSDHDTRGIRHSA